MKASPRRKVVTIVFADVVGSTALGERVDPETLRWAMQHWFVRVGSAVERHGGTVERYVGDAVMAVFGIPAAHEDDALRAVRAALDMRDDVAALRAELRDARGVDFAVRIGLNTGEAVTGEAPGGGSFTAGDAVNVAARLEQAARPGDILLGRDTFRLVGHAVDAEPTAPLEVKGKSRPIEAFRLLGVARDAPARPRREGTPMVGRRHERWRLLGAFERAVTHRSCQLFTVLGAAGVGKSRLVADVVDALGDTATVAAGRCLPYGDGLTWWPLVEALGTSGLFEQAPSHPATLRAAELLKPAGEPVAPEEAFWAIRSVLEALARRRPLVLVVDDLQWAEPTFLDLLEHLADWVRDAPLLLLAQARPELLDGRPGWSAGRPNATWAMLEPLADAEADELLRRLAGPGSIAPTAAGRILEVAEGNPLFVVEIVAMLSDDGVLGAEPAAIAVPPSIQALLAARLDRLRPGERAVIEAASLQGKEFARAPVRALVDADDVAAHLGALVRKDLIRPVGADTFRFRHQLIRDAAYEGMSKELRADLHERLADSPPFVTDEMLGHHLERAVLLRRELGDAGAATATLAARAASSLSAAGRRAGQRDDPAAAVGLLERAIALVESDEPARSALLPALGASLFEAGRITDAIRVLDDATAAAPDAGIRAWAQVERELLRLEAGTSAGTERALRVAEDALGALAGDHHGQCRAWSLRAQACWLAGSVDRADAAWEEAGACALRAGDERERFVILGWRATAAVLGPTPVDEAIRRCEELRDHVAVSPVAVALMVNPLASLHAMRGEFELADRYVGEANETLDQLGSLSWVSHHEALVRLLAGQLELAEIPLRAGVDRLASIQDRALLATTTAMLAQVLYAQGRIAEADRQCDVTAGAAAADDIVTQVIWRGVKAKILAREHRFDEAEALARTAVALVEPTDLLSHRGDAMLDLAEALRTRMSSKEYQQTLRAALSQYESKGNAVGAARARLLLGDRSGGM